MSRSWIGECASGGRWILVAVLVMTACSISLAAGTVVIDLPQQGELGEITQPAGHSVALQGFPVMWYRGQDDLGQRDIRAIACMSDSALRKSRADELPAFVHGGGGLVYLVGSGPAQIDRDESFLDRFDIHLRTRDADREDLRTQRHEITEDVDDLGDTPIPIHMYGSDQTALLRQESRAVGLAREFGDGRIVVLPIDALIGTGGSNGSDRDRVKLLAQAISWVAQAKHKQADKAFVYADREEREHFRDKDSYKRQDEPLRELPQPEDFESDEIEIIPDRPGIAIPDLPPGPMQLSDTCLVDGGGDEDGWPEIWELLQEVLREEGLQIERVAEPREDEQREDNDYLYGGPLLREIPTEPSLLVLFSWREYSWEEARAVADHVRNGGSLLALAGCEGKRQWRMRYFNRMLEEFGIAAALKRPEGPGRVANVPLTEGFDVPEIRSGIGIWGFRDIELIKAGNVTVASALLHGEGRVFVMDSTVLWRSGDRVEREFADIVRNAVDWLVSED